MSCPWQPPHTPGHALVTPTPPLCFPVLESLDMEAMLSTVQAWLRNPRKFARAHGVSVPPHQASDTFILILEGFLLYSYK